MEIEIQKLKKLSLQCVCNVPMAGRIIPARLVKVIDGDTICVVIFTGSEPLRINVRLNNIDAPETKLGGASKTSQLEKDAGLKVKKYVCNIYSKCDDILHIKILCADKYFRYVADVYLPESEETLSIHLVKIKYAKSYDGGTKIKWSDEDLRHILK